MKVYYYGVIDNDHLGHYLYEPGSIMTVDYTIQPWLEQVDCGLCPKNADGQVQGLAALHHKDGWTALAMWDRTGDSRANSCSVILCDEEKMFQEMASLFVEHFATVATRIGSINLAHEED